MVTPGQRLSQVRDTVTSLKKLDGPDLHTPVVMACVARGPSAGGRPGGYGYVLRDAR